MAKSRKDLRGRALRKGESQRASDKRYVYTYTDPLGRRKFIYANELVELREKEKQLIKDQLDGLDLYAAGSATINILFDRYISTKYGLENTTRSNYEYMYDRFVRKTFGRRLVAETKYSDILQFYLYLMNECELSIGSVENIHSLIHPAFQLAVRDDVIRKNPSDGIMKELYRNNKAERAVRHALTIEQQRAFMDYTASHPVYYHWWPLFVVLLGTGCRIGEALGLRWADLDFENRRISINHALVYYPLNKSNSRTSELHISRPKTRAGIRTIPMMDTVLDAFEMIREEQEETGSCVMELDGMSGFVFINRFCSLLTPQAVNRAIKRIINSYNSEEVIQAKKQRRKPLLLPDFSCHHLRHTFCTRLCEQESNLKVIQEIMGHADIETTMNVYAEATDRGMETALTKLSGINLF